MPTSTNADLDASLSDLRSRYGAIRGHQSIYEPGWQEVEFGKGGVTIVCYADPQQRVRAVTYYRETPPLTSPEFEGLRDVNAAGQSWEKVRTGDTVEHENTPPMLWQSTWREVWRRTDRQAVAVIDDDGWIYFRTPIWLRVLLAPPRPTPENRPPAPGENTKPESADPDALSGGLHAT